MGGIGMGEMMGMGGIDGPIAGRALCDGRLLAALLFVFGLSLFMLRVVPPGAYPDDHHPTFWILLRLLVVLQLLLWPVKLLSNAASMGVGRASFSVPFVPDVL